MLFAASVASCALLRPADVYFQSHRLNSLSPPIDHIFLQSLPNVAAVTPPSELSWALYLATFSGSMNERIVMSPSAPHVRSHSPDCETSNLQCPDLCSRNYR